MSRGAVHLFVLQADGADLRLATEGRFGCDYAWNADFTAYRCAPHRWSPGSDSSYAAYQASDIEEQS